MYSRSKYIDVAHNEVNDLGSDGARDALASLGHLPEREWTWLDCDLIIRLPDHPGGQSLEKSGLLSGCVP